MAGGYFLQNLNVNFKMEKYFLHGSLKAKPGMRDKLADILLEASRLVSKAQGCKLYVIGLSESDPDSVYVTEIWDTKEDHDNSLKATEVQELIKNAIPLVDGQPEKGQELQIIGGAGI